MQVVKCGDHLWHPDTCRWTRIEPVYDEDTGMNADTRDAIREFVALYGGYKSHLLAKIFHDLREWFRLAEWYEEWGFLYSRVSDSDSIWSYWMWRRLDQCWQDMKRLDWQITITKDRLDNKPMPKGHITEEMIARANEYPIAQILAEHGREPDRRGRYLCPYHDDTNPSMTIWKNTAYCWSCGKKDDAIGLLRKLTGKAFPAAVRTLCGGG